MGSVVDIEAASAAVKGGEEEAGGKDGALVKAGVVVLGKAVVVLGKAVAVLGKAVVWDCAKGCPVEGGCCC